jgi:uncharacterized protein
LQYILGLHFAPSLAESPLNQHNTIYAVMRRYADAWVANDGKAIIDCYHDDVAFYYFGRNPLAGTHRGKPACLAVLKQVRERTNRRLLEILDVSAGGRFGFVVARERFDREGRVADVVRVLKYTVRDDKIAECWVYDQDQDLIDSYFR